MLTVATKGVTEIRVKRNLNVVTCEEQEQMDLIKNGMRVTWQKMRERCGVVEGSFNWEKLDSIMENDYYRCFYILLLKSVARAACNKLFKNIIKHLIHKIN